MAVVPTLKLNLYIPDKLLRSLDSVDELELIAKDFHKLMDLHPEPLHWQADSRILTVYLVRDSDHFEQRQYLILDYHENALVDDKHYFASELK